jgi:NADPH:quinone reductase-like Zn-dependent oxidoreductase
VPQHTVLKIPAGISFESAASLEVPGLTAAMTLWHWLEVPFTAEKGQRKSGDFILIWGGSTITGQFAI